MSLYNKCIPELKAKYKYYCNCLNKLKNILKRRYYEQKFNTAKSDIKQTWKLVNEVISRKKKDTVSCTEFKKDNEHITDKLLIDLMNILLMSELTLQRK